MPPIVEEVLMVVLIFGAAMTLIPLLVYAERRIAAGIQDRIGPNRVGPFGLLQPLADVVKLLFKEDLRPANADKFLYTLGPVMAFVPAAMALAVVPVGRGLQILDVDMGILFAITVSSLGVYGISFGGWASNNKYSLLGGIRSSAQIISYEIALALALVSLLMVSGSIHLGEIVERQASGPLCFGWFVFKQPLAFVIFLVACFAENNRLPFDLAECESELVGGFHTEYSGMKFGMFFLGEYFAMVVMASLVVTLFLGGWDPGFFELPEGPLGTALSVAAFTLKLLVILFFYMHVRWTLPRFRYDQLMKLGWKILVPLDMANIVVTGLVVTAIDALGKAGD